jgi:hypothetical protein
VCAVDFSDPNAESQCLSLYAPTMEVDNSHFFSDHLKLSKSSMLQFFLRGRWQRSASCDLGRRERDDGGRWDGEVLYHPGYSPLKIVKLAEITEPQDKVRRSQSCRNLLFSDLKSY